MLRSMIGADVEAMRAELAEAMAGIETALAKFKADFLKCMFGALIVHAVAVVALIKLL